MAPTASSCRRRREGAPAWERANSTLARVVPRRLECWCSHARTDARLVSSLLVIFEREFVILLMKNTSILGLTTLRAWPFQTRVLPEDPCVAAHPSGAGGCTSPRGRAQASAHEVELRKVLES